MLYQFLGLVALSSTKCARHHIFEMLPFRFVERLRLLQNTLLQDLVSSWVFLCSLLLEMNIVLARELVAFSVGRVAVRWLPLVLSMRYGLSVTSLSSAVDGLFPR